MPLILIDVDLIELHFSSIVVNTLWQTRVMTTTSTLADDFATCCAPVAGGVLDHGTAERLAIVFKALGDPTRLRLVSMIAAHDGGEACVCDLVDPTGLSQPTVSHHLRLLVEAGLVSREQRGRWAYYRIVEPTLDALAQSLQRVPCQT